MCNLKKKAFRRISIWTLVFALVLTVCSFTALSVRADNFMGDVRDAASDAGNAVSEAASDVGHAVSDALDMEGSDGTVNDSDGIIGNESEEATSMDDSASAMQGRGWIGLVIALVIVIIAVVLIIILMPKKKDK